MENFIVEYGMSTSSWRAIIAFRILVSISAMGSVIDMDAPYQLDFITPGSSPLRAKFLKQILHISNFPIKPLGLPQIKHLFLALVTNLTGFLNFSIMLFLAMRPPLPLLWPPL
jgi:hypothetical protein